MNSIMQKSAMAVSASVVALSGLMIAGSALYSTIIILLIVIMLAWAGVELYIGLSRSPAGIAPAHPLIKGARILWLVCVVYSWLDLRHEWTRIYLPAGVSFVLLALCLGALALRVWAVLHLGRSFTYDVKRPEGNVLVRTGPYHFIRHPGYLGIVILATFPGLIIGSLAGFSGLLISTLVQTVTRIRAEERMLETEFGETFLEYRQHTYYLLPFVY